MKRAGVWGLVLVSMVLGTALMTYAQEGPVLDKIWAPKEVNAGDVLKIYIKAHDPNGDMRFVVITGGRGTDNPNATAGTPIRLGKDLRKDVNGYVYWDTRGAAMRNVKGTFWVMIEDWKGNESETMSCQVSLVGKDAKKEKPPAEFKEVAIGPVMATNIQRPGP